jgi:hypothetical protein
MVATGLLFHTTRPRPKTLPAAWNRCLSPIAAADLLSRAPAEDPTLKLRAFAFPTAATARRPGSALPRSRVRLRRDDAKEPLPDSLALSDCAVDAARASCSDAHHLAVGPRTEAWNGLLGLAKPGERAAGTPFHARHMNTEALRTEHQDPIGKRCVNAVRFLSPRCLLPTGPTRRAPKGLHQAGRH